MFLINNINFFNIIVNSLILAIIKGIQFFYVSIQVFCTVISVLVTFWFIIFFITVQSYNKQLQSSILSQLKTRIPKYTVQVIVSILFQLFSLFKQPQVYPIFIIQFFVKLILYNLLMPSIISKFPSQVKDWVPPHPFSSFIYEYIKFEMEYEYVKRLKFFKFSRQFMKIEDEIQISADKKFDSHIKYIAGLVKIWQGNIKIDKDQAMVLFDIIFNQSHINQKDNGYKFIPTYARLDRKPSYRQLHQPTRYRKSILFIRSHIFTVIDSHVNCIMKSDIVNKIYTELKSVKIMPQDRSTFQLIFEEFIRESTSVQLLKKLIAELDKLNDDTYFYLKTDNVNTSVDSVYSMLVESDYDVIVENFIIYFFGSEWVNRVNIPVENLHKHRSKMIIDRARYAESQTRLARFYQGNLYGSINYIYKFRTQTEFVINEAYNEVQDVKKKSVYIQNLPELKNVVDPILDKYYMELKAEQDSNLRFKEAELVFKGLHYRITTIRSSLGYDISESTQRVQKSVLFYMWLDLHNRFNKTNNLAYFNAFKGVHTLGAIYYKYFKINSQEQRVVAQNQGSSALHRRVRHYLNQEVKKQDEKQKEERKAQRAERRAWNRKIRSRKFQKRIKRRRRHAKKTIEYFTDLSKTGDDISYTDIRDFSKDNISPYTVLEDFKHNSFGFFIRFLINEIKAQINFKLSFLVILIFIDYVVAFYVAAGGGFQFFIELPVWLNHTGNSIKN